MIPVTGRIALHEDEVQETFVRASGPGGQNVNKVASAVELRFDAANSPNLPDGVKTRLRALAGRRMNQDGTIVITAQAHCSQDRNRTEALDRLVTLIRAACVVPKPRRATRPTLASKERRLAGKERRGRVKVLRGREREKD